MTGSIDCLENDINFNIQPNKDCTNIFVKLPLNDAQLLSCNKFDQHPMISVLNGRVNPSG